MKRSLTLILVLGLMLLSLPVTAVESIIVLDDPDLKRLNSAFLSLEGEITQGSAVKVNGEDAQMFKRFESTVKLRPAPSYTPVKIDVLDENKNFVENQTLHIENYKRTEATFYMSWNVMTVNDTSTATEVRPQIVGSIVYIPFCYVCEAFFGKSSTWDEEAQTETFSGGGYEVTLPLDSKAFYVNGEEKKYFECEPVRVMGETLVAFWLPEDAFGCNAYWNKYSKTVSFVNEFHPEKDFEDETPKPESKLEFVDLKESVVTEKSIIIKGNIPLGYSMKVDGQLIQTVSKFKKTVNITEKITDNPIFIEVFDENGEFIESKSDFDFSDGDMIMMTWMFQENMLIRGKVKSYGIEPYIINGSSFVPIDAIVDAFDLESVFNADSRTYIIENEFIKIELPLDKDYFLVDDVKCEWYSPAAVIVDGKATVLFLPMVEALGFCVEWIPAERIVKVTK